MKISFVNAFYFSDMPNIALGLESLKYIINEKSNHIAEILDFNLLDHDESNKFNIYIDDYDYIIQKILESKPDIISFYTMSCSIHISIFIAEKIKTINPNKKIILAGPHASLLPVDLLEKFKFIDIIAIGEGESYIVDLLNKIEEKDRNLVGNIYYRQGNRIVNNSDSYPLIADLDDLPIIDYYESFTNDNLDAISIEVGRGCPFGCTYCSTKTFWKRKFRIKSIHRLIEEITFFKNKYGIDKFIFVHDLFTANRNYITEFCKTLIEQGIKIQWNCSSRIDTLDKELLLLMKKAGCISLYLGIETGSQRMQKIINKNLNLEKINSLILYMKELELSITASFIYGFPEENLTDLKNTLLLIRNLKEHYKIDIVQLHICEFLPGTNLFDRFSNDLYFDENAKDLTLQSVNVSKHIDMIKEYPRIFSAFYNYKNEITDKYPKLDVFVNYVYNKFVERLPNTFHIISSNKKPEGFILSLYEKFSSELSKLEKIMKDIENIKNNSKLLLETLKLCEVFVEDEENYIKDLYEFELSKVKVNIDKSREYIIDLNYDIFKLLKSGDVIESRCRYRMFVIDNKLRVQHIKIKS